MRKAAAEIGSALLAGVIPIIQHGGEVERATDVLTTEAQRQINLQYETADAHDVKTMGMVAAAVAVAAFLATTRHDWSLWWGVPLLVFMFGIACFLMSLWQRKFERGPNVEDLYRHFNGTMMEAKGAILQELVVALGHNEAQLAPKARWYAAGCWGLAFAGWLTAVFLVLHV